MTVLWKNAEYARNVGSPKSSGKIIYFFTKKLLMLIPKPEAKEVIATPVRATHSFSANATTTKPPTATVHDIVILVLCQNGRNGERNLINSPGTTSANRIMLVL